MQMTADECYQTVQTGMKIMQFTDLITPALAYATRNRQAER
jgi:hypothetical protein